LTGPHSFCLSPFLLFRSAFCRSLVLPFGRAAPRPATPPLFLVSSLPSQLGNERPTNQPLKPSKQPPKQPRKKHTATPPTPTPPGDSTGRFSGVADCFLRTAREEGLGAFYKGFIPNFARLGSWNVVMFLTLEQTKKAFQPKAEATAA
jgi:hypothetical protein